MVETIDDIPEELSDIRSLLAFIDKKLEQANDSLVRNQNRIYSTYIKQAKETLTRVIIRVDRLDHA